uniref:Major pollen allergen Dac g 4 (Fragments) n=1 Tax=Dactylis glomerata TaxID=4509 RepID=MPAG4_DACGL|nr:RecName: Full=Major pollen allergen Dac g 4; AltName: Allergen=Dac g 4 [Dactylis glomerata]
DIYNYMEPYVSKVDPTDYFGNEQARTAWVDSGAQLGELSYGVLFNIQYVNYWFAP